MYRFIIGMLIVLASTSAYAQVEGWLYFVDKPQAEQLIDEPQLFLSQRAVDRRALNEIPIDFYDVPLHSPYIDQISTIESIEILAQSKWLNAVYLRIDEENIPLLLAQTAVERLQLANHLTLFPLEISCVDQWDEASYGLSWPAVSQLHLQQLHTASYTGNGVLIAVMDNGFERLNQIPAFSPMISEGRLLDMYNYVQRSTQVFEQGAHGTMVMSTLAAYEPNALIGGAPHAEYLLYVTEDTTRETPLETALWIEAAERADYLGADILTTSLGYVDFDNTAYTYTYAMLDGQQLPISRAAHIAATRGLLVINSAGNSGNSNFPWIGAPADAADVIAVGAVTATGDLASFSSIGPSADGRMKPDLVAQGVANPVYMPNGDIAYVNGTSFSGPWIAAGFACLRQALPEATVAQLKAWVFESAHQYATPNNAMGYGIPNFSQALQLGTAALEVNELAGVASLQVVPNPVGNKFTLYTHQTDPYTIRIYDAYGRLLRSEIAQHSHWEMNTSQWPKGIYWLEVQAAAQRQHLQIIK